MTSFYVFIIYSHSLDKYYVGYSIDLEKRLIEHNSGISIYTSKANDWKLKWSNVFLSREDAMKEEKRIKIKKSRKYIEWMISTAG